MLSDERRAEIERWAHRRFGNGKHGGYHSPLGKMLIDLLHAHDDLADEVERLRADAKLGAAVQETLQVVMDFWAYRDDEWCAYYDQVDGRCGSCKGCRTLQLATLFIQDRSSEVGDAE